jgi:hypothetical protein
VSPSLVELVEHQIGTVPEKVRDVVDLVAVAEPIDLRCLAELVEPLALEEAQQRELIRTTDAADAVYVGHPMYARCGSTSAARCGCGACGASWRRPCRSLPVRPIAFGGASSGWNPTSRDPRVLAAAASAASSLQDFELAERLSRAAADAGDGVGARVELAYNLLMLRKGADAADVLDEIPGDDVAPSAFINDVILRAANLLWTLRSPEESWRVIDDALVTATSARTCQLLASAPTSWPWRDGPPRWSR